MAKTLYVIDGHAHIYSAYFAPMRQQLTSPSGEPTKATFIFTTALLGLINRHQPDMLVVAMDTKAPTFRREMYPEYKAHRSPMPEDMPAQIDRILQILEAMHIPILRKDGFEADDIMGTLAKRATEAGVECLLCSKDKDVMQLLSEWVSAFDLKKDVKTTMQGLKEDKGITPAQFLEYLALQGDTADNIPGVPDVGPKTALTWIQTYGTLENLYAHADEIKGKRGERLRDSRDILDLSKRLVTIDCDVPIEIDFEAYRLKPFDTQVLADLFQELGFTRLAAQLDLPASEATDAVLAEPDCLQSAAHDYRLIDTEDKLDDMLEGLRGQTEFAIDTETTSLRPMSAELVGISLSWQPHQGYYLPVKAPLGQRCLSKALLQTKLGPILADDAIKKIGQNIKYDMLILANAGMDLRGIHFDTMVASYCLEPSRQSHSMDNMARDYLNYECVSISELIGKGKKQVTFDVVDTALACDYAAEDADITFRLYECLKPRLAQLPRIQALFEQVEMPLVSVLATMETNGVSLDTAILRKMSGEICRTLDDVTDEIYQQAEGVFNIDSPKQLAGILFDKLALTSIRRGKTGRSTDAAVLEQISQQHPIVDLVLTYRQLNKLRNTYVDKLGGMIDPVTGRLHTSFNQTVAVTGRLSSSDPNLQNIPIRTELGKQIRAAFVARHKTDCILTADYSQIELRLLAHLSQDPALLEAFRSDQDIHRFVASQIYGLSPEEVTDEMRSRCKAVNFGIIYGQGAFGLSRTVGMSVGEARRFIEDYFARYGAIRAFMDRVVERAQSHGYVETMLHRRRNLPDIHSSNANHLAQAKRMAINTVVQGSAADLIKVAMIHIQQKIEAERLPVKMLLQVHDELVFELPTSEAPDHAKWIEAEMAEAMSLDVPLKVRLGYGPNWLSGK
ncbi:MAG: DNA polymerase I [Planctomycetes bacterium]|nr:DNA polymerase I [Planctomycetota bacterium]